jgi:transposase
VAEGASSASARRRRGTGGIKKKHLAAALSAAVAAHVDRRIELWFADEARVGQKGRVGHRWWPRGLRAPGLCDKRFESAYLFGAVRPASGDSFALVLPEVSSEAMNVFLRRFADRLAVGVHGVLVLDQAGWHTAKAVVVPSNVTLVKLPAYSPELNPVERVWLHLRERHLSHRLLKNYNAVVTACCKAWNRFASDKDRVRSLTEYPWIKQVHT